MIVKFKEHSPKIDKTTFVAENATVIGNVTVGKDCGLWFGAVLRGDSNSITIGSHSNIQDLCVIHVNFVCKVSIGNYVTVGHRAIIHGCTIKDRVLIGMGSIIMNSAQIGEDSIIGAGAVVTENTIIPPRSLVLGVPGKVKREVTGEEVRLIMESAEHYAEYAKMYLKI